MGAPFNSSGRDISPTLSHDGLIFIFGSNRSGGSGNYDLWMCTKPSVQDAWGPPVNMGPSVNGGSQDYCGNLSPDGLVMLFESDRSGSYRSWVTMRRTVNDPWEPALPLPEPMHSMEVGPFLADGSMYYAGGMMYYPRMSQVPILPIVDFNGDETVDSVDLCRMADHWGEDEPSCDVGPMPWGDGIVDFRDLLVLTEYWLVESGLVTHWKLDEADGDIAHDTVGNYHGTLHGNPLWQPADGKVDGALAFDGIDDYMTTDFALNPKDGPFSVFAWIKGGAPNQVIIYQPDAKWYGCTWLCTDPSDGRLITGLMRRHPALESPTVITDDQWHYVGLTWDGWRRRLYVDGAEVAKDINILHSIPSNGGLYFGIGKDLDAASCFSGLIDDIRIYNRAVTP